ncbi:MAG: hypothetical protein ACFFDN_26265, partial [Candidatus Hodarchaeota archaeon]
MSQRTKFKTIIFTLSIFFMALILNTINFNVNPINENGNQEEDGDFNPMNSHFISELPIFIDDINPDYNWSKIKSENIWCTGSGTFNDPYIIQNLEINGLNSISCIE